MSFHIYHIPSFIPALLTNLTWRKDTDFLYLTFDDGPVPGVTDWVLHILHQYGIKATFFCVGDNIKKHGSLFNEVVRAGHAIGNHTYHHLDGSRYNKAKMWDNIARCDDIMGEHGVETTFYRPPYGKIGHTRGLQREIVMWTVLPGDYNQKLDSATILKKSLKHTHKGSIITFHDQPKAETHLRKVLPEYIRILLDQGFEFRAL